MRKKALLIEDEPMISLICERVLTAEGFAVDKACNGLAAVERLGNSAYGLCLSDILTPGMNGMELYEYLERTHPELKARTIFTTGDLLNPIIREFLSSGDKKFILKPFTPAELLSKIREVLDGQAPKR